MLKPFTMVHYEEAWVIDDVKLWEFMQEFRGIVKSNPPSHNKDYVNSFINCNVLPVID